MMAVTSNRGTPAFCIWFRVRAICCFPTGTVPMTAAQRGFDMAYTSLIQSVCGNSTHTHTQGLEFNSQINTCFLPLAREKYSNRKLEEEKEVKPSEMFAYFRKASDKAHRRDMGSTQ